MRRELQLETPEQVEVRYDLARLGSRFIAALWDSFLIVLLIWLATMVTGVVGTFLEPLGNWVGNALVALYVLLVFGFFFGYYVLFETIWNGQTPGKRAARIRTVRRDGTPLTLVDSLIRNIVRLVDFLPGAYGFGMIVMFVDHESRRLGDFAAGTLVVHDQGSVSLARVRASRFEARPEWLSPPLANLHRLNPQEVAAARRFLLRRHSLTNADALATELAARLRARLALEGRDDYDDLEFLQRVVAQRAGPLEE